jgi:AAA family ATP:ADP antiporter
MLDGLKQIFTNPFIGTMAIMMLLSDAIGTISYVLVTDYSGIAFPNNVIAQTQFAAHMDLAANVIQVIVQLTVTRWLLVRFGAGSVFAVCSAVVVVTCLMMALSPDPFLPVLATMPPVALVMIVTRSLSHGMIQPARESLYTLVARSLKYKGKNAVDTVVWRAGDILSIISIRGFRYLGVHVAGFGFIWAALAALAGFIGWRLSNRVEKGEFTQV